jgi:2',3'-cyclic-nucleotide 2'-phosphodiesterase/3'-nucleotidase
MQGTPLAGETEGRAVVDVLKAMRYSAATLGEHDFDWGTDTLRQRMADAGYPWLAANVFDSASGRRPDWIVPYRIVRAGDASVAVIGYVTPTAKATLPDDRTRGLRFGEGELALHDLLGAIAAQKPALTILLAHAGLDCTSVVCGGEAVRLAEQLERSGVGLIIAGHGHAAGTAGAGGIPIVQPNARGASVAVVDLVKTPAGGLEARPRVVTVDRGSASHDPALLAALQFYRRRSDSVDARPIAQLKRPLPREGAQYALGGLIAEARRNAVRADVGLVRNETMRADLPAGTVSYARLTAVEPARADIVAVTLTGVQLRAVLEHVLDGGAPSAHIAGAQVRYDPAKPVGRRIKDVVLQGKRDLKSGSRYVLAVDAATAEGAGGYEMLRGVPVERGGMIDVEADAAFLRKLPQPVDVGGTAGFVSTRP